MRIAFATFAGLPDGRDDDRAAAALLGAKFRVWDDPAVNWTAFDRVVIRSTWDYTHDRRAFLSWARAVGPARLRNPPDLIAWNTDKRYLDELPVPTVPTAFVRPDGPRPPLLGEVVVKPNVSAGGVDTGRFPPERHGEAHALISRIQASGRTALIQPYLPSVDERGETALVYLGGRLSHVLHKRAVLRAPGEAPLASGAAVPSAAVMHDPDLVTPGTADADERALAEAVLGALGERFGTPLYVRVDLVRDGNGRPMVMEIEATEPCLYMEMAPGSAERLAAATLAG
jgi:glutathione synthase/RimK-type ligase-like ATP-grasp enzyme